MMDKPGVAEALRRFWQRSYASDYLGLALVILSIAIVSASSAGTGTT
jgi:hypothetical protein